MGRLTSKADMRGQDTGQALAQMLGSSQNRDDLGTAKSRCASVADPRCMPACLFAA